jgi:hypothetical protein
VLLAALKGRLAAEEGERRELRAQVESGKE